MTDDSEQERWTDEIERHLEWLAGQIEGAEQVDFVGVPDEIRDRLADRLRGGDSERWTEHPSEWDDATLSCALKDDSLTEAMREPVRKEAARRLRGGEGEREPPYCLDCGHPPAYHAGSHCAATMVGEDGEENPCGCESDRHFLGRDALSPTDGEGACE